MERNQVAEGDRKFLSRLVAANGTNKAKLMEKHIVTQAKTLECVSQVWSQWFNLFVLWPKGTRGLLVSGEKRKETQEDILEVTKLLEVKLLENATKCLFMAKKLCCFFFFKCHQCRVEMNLHIHLFPFVRSYRAEHITSLAWSEIYFNIVKQSNCCKKELKLQVLPCFF